MDVVVVESPAKAKTINKYLGENYVVLASYGHVRDLPSRDGSVQPDDGFAMTYETDPRAAKHLAEIARALKGASHLYLATDPDREGEAISWHVQEALKERNSLKHVEVKRVVFNAITRSAVLDAMHHPRDVDMDLVNAQQARRALDYLVGFTLSPVLWRKLPGARSAGRVQSVALRLICEREIEIESFKPIEYWTVEVDFVTADGSRFTARLVRLDESKLDRFDLGREADAAAAVARIEAQSFRVAEVTTKPTRRNPYAPFTTSTLQQEAARKLGFSAKRTMDVAQRLYEGVDIGGETVGLITYMRTDGVQIADEAITAVRQVITQDFGSDYLPSAPRLYKVKAKNAQEAHEAIRPTDLTRRPADVGRYLDEAQRRLYELVWKRTVASQMESARLERTTAEIVSADGALGLRATGTVELFPGFLKLYEEGRDDRPQQSGEDEDDRRLPRLNANDALTRDAIRPEQHFTEPQPRFTEATLVKRLEELGIGRPSTYAAILSVLQERGYVRLDAKRFVPEDKGRLVTAFLVSFFSRYVEYDFTAEKENRLDEISAGAVAWTDVLRDFWGAFRTSVADTSELRVKDVLAALDEILGPHIFAPATDGHDPRVCPVCGQGRLSLKLGKFGAFVGCSNYPDCRYTRPLGTNGDEAQGGADEGPRLLGEDPETGQPVTLRRGPYGPYVQLGDPPAKSEVKPKPKAKTKAKAKAKAAAGEAAPALPETPALPATQAPAKPKRASLPKGMAPETIDLALALRLLALPRIVGEHPETGKPVTAGLGRFGPYLEHDRAYTRLTSAEEAMEIGLNRAVELIAQAKSAAKGGRRGPQPLRALGNHPRDQAPVQVFQGRYGPYVSHGGVHATLPPSVTPETVDLDTALSLLAARAAKAAEGKGKGAPRRAGKAAAPKAAAKPKATAKPKAAGRSKAVTSKAAKPKDADTGPARPKRRASASGTA